MKQLTGLDAFFLHGETSRQAMNLTGLGCYDPSTAPGGKVTFEDVLDFARERTALSPLFRRRLLSAPLGSDQPYWMEDANFAVENHVFHVALPGPGTREQLDKEVARIHALQVNREHPLWEWWFIEGLNDVEGVPPGSFGLAFKLHHAAFDGVSAWEVISVTHDRTASPNEPPPSRHAVAPDGRPLTAPPPSKAVLAQRAYAKAWMSPVKMFETLMGSSQILAEALRREPRDFPLYGGQAPATPFNRALSPKRTHSRIKMQLADTKLVRQQAKDSTVNDVVLTIISGALRRYLHHHAQLPVKSLVVGVPVSTRAEGRKEDAGNEAMMALLPLCTDIADPMDRLAKISEWTAAKKNYVKALPPDNLPAYMDFVPGMVLRAGVIAYTKLKMADVMAPAYNLVVTNVPASKDEIYFAHSRMVDYDAFGPIWDGSGLLHVITSYLGVISVSFDADATLLPDTSYYRECLEASKVELIEAASARASTKVG